MADNRPNSYKLSRDWFDFCFENPEKAKPIHTAVYFFAIEHCNRLGWKEKFGFPTTMVMEAIGVKSYNTYIKILNDLVDWEFIKMIEKSKNQYSANIVALSYFNKALNKALDKALIKHDTKHTTKQSESTGQSTQQSIDSVIKQITNNQLNKEQINQLTITLEEFNSSKKETVKILVKNQGGIDKKKSCAKKRKEEISPNCKEYFLDYYKNQKGLDFYWSAAEAKSLNQLIQKIRVVSGGKSDDIVLGLFYTFIDKVKAADEWIYDNLSIRILNQKFNELIPKMKKVSADGQKQNIPEGYNEMMEGYLKIINDE